MIIACTGHTEEEYILRGWRSKIDEVIPKPANIQVFKEIINQIIEIID